MSVGSSKIDVKECCTWYDCPIILLGTHRSGTTWLGSFFSNYPEFAYWEEPRSVWSWGNNYKPDDVLQAKDARPRVSQHIRRRFARFVEESGKRRLFEKTPSNCLRVPFIRKIYPNAKILHVIRDGRSVFSSAEQLMISGYCRPNVLSRRIGEILVETPFWEWPASFSRLTDITVAKVTKRPMKFWGPRPKGWRDWVRSDSSNVLLAKQWVASINCAMEDTQDMDSQHYYRVKYEDLVSCPSVTMKAVVDFLEIADAQRLANRFAETVDVTTQKPWTKLLSSSSLQEIRPYLEPTIKQLGYEW